MSQIEAPRDCAFKTFTEAERKRATAWVEDDGWCSCCRRGLGWGKSGKVVHLGKSDMNVALCMTCLGKMTKAVAAHEKGGDT